MKRIKPKATIILHIQGDQLYLFEYNSKMKIEKILKKAEKHYGITFEKKCLSLCG